MSFRIGVLSVHVYAAIGLPMKIQRRPFHRYVHSMENSYLTECACFENVYTVHHVQDKIVPLKTTTKSTT